MDAPCHFVPGAATIDDQDLGVVVGDALVVDLAPASPRQLFEIEDFAQVENSVTAGCRLLLRTDWHKRYGTSQYRDELPRISIGLAEWLVERRVSLIGVEPPSVADVNNIEEVTRVHQTLFREMW